MSRPRSRPVFTPPGGPGGVTPPSRAIFAAMGQANIERMLEDFYQRLGRSSIAHLFPDDLVTASRRSAAFFVGILGGPPLYQQRYGPPMMRARHLPFEIDEQARQVWLACFRDTLAHATTDYGFPAEHLDGFVDFLEGFSAWMVNAAPDDAGPTSGLGVPTP